MWTKRDWICTGFSAVAGFGLTLAAGWPVVATADDNWTLSTVIVQPTLKFGDFTITARPSGVTNDAQAQLKPGPVPSMELVATNNGSDAGTVQFAASVFITKIRDQMSRVAIPGKSTPVWEESYTLDLKPGETRIVPIEANATLGPLSTATLNLRAGSTTITALSMSTQPRAIIAVAPTTRASQ